MKGIFGREYLQNIHKTLQEQFSVGAFTHAFSKQVSGAIVGIVKVKTFTQEFVRIADCYIGPQAGKDNTRGCPDRPPCSSSQVIKH
jgi:hypothetical protein